jgi:HEAT repeat protein
MVRDIYRPSEYNKDTAQRAVSKLKSFHDGDIAVLDVIACGDQALPSLRALLFAREPSGLYQARVRAVDALARLGANQVLIEFLEADGTISDPVERVGEDAVINAAALALADVRLEKVFELLLRLARRPALTGVIGALGAFGRVEAIPVLIDALGEDASRITAEVVLRKLGDPARTALLKIATVRPSERESESSARRRRSALRLLSEMGLPSDAWPSLRFLAYDTDAKIAATACEICLDRGPAAERPTCTRCLIRLLAHGDWILRREIESCLVAHFDRTRNEIECYLNEAPPPDEDAAMSRQIEIVLRRVISRAQATPHA